MAWSWNLHFKTKQGRELNECLTRENISEISRAAKTFKTFYFMLSSSSSTWSSHAVRDEQWWTPPLGVTEWSPWPFYGSWRCLSPSRYHTPSEESSSRPEMPPTLRCPPPHVHAWWCPWWYSLAQGHRPVTARFDQLKEIFEWKSIRVSRTWTTSCSWKFSIQTL